MIDLTCFPGLATLDLGPFVSKPTSIEGQQVEASVTLATSADGRTQIGVWECSEGRFTADRSTNSEFATLSAAKWK